MDSDLLKIISEKIIDQELLLMTHAVVGYPSLEENWHMMRAMNDAGVSIVELQLPFSEPIADGPVFVKANKIALQNSISWDEYFEFMKKVSREFNFAVIFMGYYNSIFCMGHGNFCQRLKDAGGQGYIVADLPPEQAVDLDRLATANGLAPIHLMAPTNTNQRLAQINRNADGFIYCVARKGVTGKKTELDQAIIEYIKRCRQATSLPIALGFGIQSPEDLQQLHGHVDIAVIGTGCLQVWERGGEEALRDYLSKL